MRHFSISTPLGTPPINRRFFNVIHLLSHSIPIIAIQVALLESSDKRSLFFTTVLDTFEEVDDGTSIDGKTYKRDYWTETAKWTLETAETLLTFTRDIFTDPALSYVKHYVAITVSGHNYFWLHKRSSNKSLLGFRMAQALQDETAALLDGNDITYVRKPREFLLTVDKQMIEKHRDVMRSLAALVKKTWSG